ncbi:MAG: hypothetical protein JXB39_13580 [Deltaproteobacteria bacterium]|nr:hypothetical protein [Deltaproteobacteria bacterium]
MLSALLLVSCTFAADAILGVAWEPFSRTDAISDGNWTSGTGVGEFDGLLKPALTFHGGIATGDDSVLIDLGIARITTTRWLSDGYSQVHVGGLHLGATWRHDLERSESGRAVAWGEIGAYGVIPSARDVSDAYTEAEQEDADESAAQIRKTIGGVGGRLGPGFGIRIGEDTLVGARFHAVLFRGQRLEEASLTVSTAVWGEAALLFEVRL